MSTQKSRLYFSRLTHNAAKQGLSLRARAHSLRVKDEIEKARPIDGIKPTLDRVCQPERMKNNSIYVFDELINPDDQDELKAAFDRINAFHKKQQPPVTPQSKIERAKANKVREKFRNYTKKEEKEQVINFFNSLADRVGIEKIDYEKELAELKDLEAEHGKIKQFGAKTRAILEASEIKPAGLGPHALTVTSAEYVYKFTDNSNINLSNEQLKEIADYLHEDLFSDFTRTYLAIHADENPDNAHFHFEISGKSNKTNKFELNQAVFERIRDTPEGLAVDWSSDKASELKREEITVLGECVQERIFNMTNEFLIKYGYLGNVAKRTPEEVEQQQEQFLDKHRPTTARTHNWANKKKEEIELKAKKYASNKKEEIELKANKYASNKKKMIDEKASEYRTEQKAKIDEEMKVYETAERSRIDKIIDKLKSAAKKAVHLAVDAIVLDRIFSNKAFNEFQREIRKNNDITNNFAKEVIEQHDFKKNANPHKHQEIEQNKKDVLGAFNAEKKRRKRKPKP